jgi:hypothetical protein
MYLLAADNSEYQLQGDTLPRSFSLLSYLALLSHPNATVVDMNSNYLESLTFLFEDTPSHSCSNICRVHERR